MRRAHRGVEAEETTERGQRRQEKGEKKRREARGEKRKDICEEYRPRVARGVT